MQPRETHNKSQCIESVYIFILNEIREFADREDVWSCECQTAISGMCGIPSLLRVLIRLLDLIG